MIQKTLIILCTVKPVKTEPIYIAILLYTETFYDPSKNNAMQLYLLKLNIFLVPCNSVLASFTVFMIK